VSYHVALFSAGCGLLALSAVCRAYFRSRVKPSCVEPDAVDYEVRRWVQASRSGSSKLLNPSSKTTLLLSANSLDGGRALDAEQAVALLSKAVAPGKPVDLAALPGQIDDAFTQTRLISERQGLLLLLKSGLPNAVAAGRSLNPPEMVSWAERLCREFHMDRAKAAELVGIWNRALGGDGLMLAPPAEGDTQRALPPTVSSSALGIVKTPSNQDAVTHALAPLRSVIDAAADGATVPLGSGEFSGDCEISENVTLEGESPERPAHIVGQAGPTVKLSGALTLINVAIEAADGGVALEKLPGASLSVRNVTVRGKVVGVAGEDGAWDIPTSVSLSGVPADAECRRTLVVDLPVACAVTSGIAGIEPAAKSVGPGVCRIELAVEAGRAGTVIFGYLNLDSPNFRRRIQVTAKHAADPEAPLDAVAWKCAKAAAADPAPESA
jgi:hypothetical protein